MQSTNDTLVAGIGPGPVAESGGRTRRPGATARVAPTAPAVSAPQGMISRRTAGLIALAALVIGASASALLVRQRYKQKETAVYVSVNGAVIRKPEFWTRLERAGGAQIMRQMVGEELKRQYAQKIGVLPTQADVEARYAALAKQDNFDRIRLANGLSVDDVKNRIRVSLTDVAVLGKGAQVSDAEARAFYNRNIDKTNRQAIYYRPESVTFATVITPTETEAKQAAQELTDGVPFTTVVTTHSVDPSKENSGIVGPILKGRTNADKVPGLEPTLFSMKVGDQIGPRQFAGKWWIIRCIDKAPAETQPFELVKEECRSAVAAVKGLSKNGKSVEADFNDFKKKASVKAFVGGYQTALDKL